MTTAYVYKWTHLPTMKWYIGSRTSKKSHVEDGYICSSRIVKPLIINDKTQWKREIIATGNPIEMRNLEAEILKLFDAKNDSRSFNQHNGDGKFCTIGIPSYNKGLSLSSEQKTKISISRKGQKRNPVTIETRKILREQKLGIKNPTWSGYYIDPNGTKYITSYEGAKVYDVSARTISRWAKANKNGWYFVSSMLGDPELNGTTIKGEIQ